MDSGSEKSGSVLSKNNHSCNLDMTILSLVRWYCNNSNNCSESVCILHPFYQVDGA